MINYQNGKNIATAGFALSLLTVVANVLFTFGRYILGGFYLTWLYRVSSITNWVSILAICITAGGFGIMWLSEHEMLDFAAAGWLGIRLVYSLFFADFLATRFPLVIYYCVSYAVPAVLYLILALRVKDKNQGLFLLLGCAVLFEIAMAAYYMFVPGLLPWRLVFLVSGAGSIVCTGLCLLSVRAK